ncbi:MAG: hypothetical protein KAI29_20785, partial [Cyclobacteriaceae bacterium]|nr:hypothetical protein [Cyclobacteriaceae bacterium]
SPWLIIPILAYNLANNYLKAEDDRTTRKQTTEELLSIAETNPSMKGAISYFLVRTDPGQDYRSSLAEYLDLVKYFSKGDTIKPAERYQLSFQLLGNITNYYGSGASYYSSKYFLKKQSLPDSIVVIHLMMESEKHENGTDRFVQALTEDSIVLIRKNPLLAELIGQFLKENKVKGKTRKKIIGS